MKHIVPFVWGLWASLLLYACANPGMPTGGPKDDQPPKLLLSVPKDQSLQYRGKIVKLVFNEYLDLKNLKNDLLITPSIKGEYEYKLKKNILTLEFEEALAENTTYVLDFGETVRDANEKNVAPNLRIAFSTGDKIDTAFVKGKVTHLFTNKPEIKCIVALYNIKDTSDIDKGKPMYYTRTDSSGNYQIKNIRPGKYKMYALLEGKVSNLKYDQNEEHIAIDTQLVDLETRNFALRNLQTTQYDVKPLKVSSKRPLRHYFELRANKRLTAASVGFNDTSFAKKIGYNIDKDVVRFYNTGKLNATDSTKLFVQLADSVGNSLTDTTILKFTDLKETRKTAFNADLLPKSGDKLAPDEMKKLKITFKFSKPIAKFYPDSMSYALDTDTTFKPLAAANFKASPDQAEFIFSQGTNAKEKIRLNIKKGAFISVENDSIKKQSVELQVRKPEEHGSISGEVRTSHKSFVVQLLDAKFNVEQELPNAYKFKFSYLMPGEKRIRILIDNNGNGKWENGDFAKRIPPESIFVFPEAIKVKPNWDYEDNLIELEKSE